MHMTSDGVELELADGGTAVVAIGDTVRLKGGCHGWAQSWTKRGILVRLHRTVDCQGFSSPVAALDVGDGEILSITKRHTELQR